MMVGEKSHRIMNAIQAHASEMKKLIDDFNEFHPNVIQHVDVHGVIACYKNLERTKFLNLTDLSNGKLQEFIAKR